jgi:hypothetical protein
LPHFLLSLLLLLLMAHPDPAGARSHALLIGVAAYDNTSIRSLQGPRNDVIMMWRMLRERGFDADEIAVLAEGLPAQIGVPVPKAAPTRAEIISGFARLAEQAGPGDFVVIQFSGHGTTQPEVDPDHDPEPEPGGRDQVLLPKDAGSYDAATRRIHNGLIDDEIGEALDRIRAKGATVWAVIDACHAGTVTRSGTAVTRAVEPAALGVPEATPRATPAAAPERGGVIKGLGRKGSLIGFFAVDSWTEAIERDFPGMDGAFATTAGKHHFGVFTWHLARALGSGRAQTFRDLARLITLDMTASSNLAQAPLPVFDGDLDLPLFGGQVKGPPRFAAKSDAAELVIDAGSLNGFDVGAEVGVFDGPLADARRLASARIVSADTGKSRATLAGNLPALPATAWVTPEVPGVAFRFRVGTGAAPDAKRQLVRQWLERALAAANDSDRLAVDVTDDGTADMQVIADDGRLWLVPEGQALVKQPDAYDRSFAIAVAGRPESEVAADLRNALWTFARAANLVRLAGAAEIGGQSNADIDITLERVRETDPNALVQPMRSCAGPSKPSDAGRVASGGVAAVSHCDQIRLSITNRGALDVDVGVFFLDPMGEVSVPVRDWRQNGCVGFVPAKATRPLTLRTVVRTWTDKGPSHTGQHRVLVFAMPRTDRLPPSLCHLLQSSADKARAEIVATRAGGTRRGFTALLERAALADASLRAANPFEDEPGEGASVMVRQFTLDIRPPQQRR